MVHQLAGQFVQPFLNPGLSVDHPFAGVTRGCTLSSLTAMYEHRGQAPLSTRAFRRRLTHHVGAVIVILLASLGVGMAGYAYFEGLGWLDAFLNAAMLLGGMGPVESPATPGGKVFAGVYALYAGGVLLVTAGIVFAPIVHRLLHRFHWDER